MLNFHLGQLDGCCHLGVVLPGLLSLASCECGGKTRCKLKPDTGLVRFYYPTCPYGDMGEVIQAGTQLTIGCMPRIMTNW